MSWNWKDFEIDGFADEVITASYMFEYADDRIKWINCSPILTKLIFAAGRFAENCASDLFILWEKIYDKLKSGEIGNESFLFGFYKNGVDPADEVFRHYNIGERYYYRAVYRLDFTVDKNVVAAKLARVR